MMILILKWQSSKYIYHPTRIRHQNNSVCILQACFATLFVDFEIEEGTVACEQINNNNNNINSYT